MYIIFNKYFPIFHFLVYNKRTYHECEGGIEKSILRITVCYHEACLSHPHIDNGLFFLLTIAFRKFIFLKRLPEASEYAKMGHKVMSF